jgi:hypothetical protein
MFRWLQRKQKYFPILFRNTEDGFMVHCAIYLSHYEKLKEGKQREDQKLILHFFLKKRFQGKDKKWAQKEVGFAIFETYEKKKFTVIRSETHDPSLLDEKKVVDMSSRFLPLVFQTLDGMVSLSQLKKKFEPEKVTEEFRDAIFSPDGRPHPSPPLYPEEPLPSRALSLPQKHSNSDYSLQCTSCSAWCEPHALFCLKYGGLPTPIFDELKRQLQKQTGVKETKEPPKKIHLWTKLSILTELGVVFSQSQLDQQEENPGPIICRFHALETAYLTHNPQIVDAMTCFLAPTGMMETPAEEVKGWTYETRIARVVEHAAAQGNWRELKIILQSEMFLSAPEEKRQKMITRRAFYWACSGGHLKALQVLLQAKAPFDQEAIWTACRQGRQDVLVLLVQSGIRIDRKWALENCRNNGHWFLLDQVDLEVNRNMVFKTIPKYEGVEIY